LRVRAGLWPWLRYSYFMELLPSQGTCGEIHVHAFPITTNCLFPNEEKLAIGDFHHLCGIWIIWSTNNDVNSGAELATRNAIWYLRQTFPNTFGYIESESSTYLNQETRTATEDVHGGDGSSESSRVLPPGPRAAVSHNLLDRSHAVSRVYHHASFACPCSSTTAFSAET
jgi:hypothetical protein